MDKRFILSSFFIGIILISGCVQQEETTTTTIVSIITTTQQTTTTTTITTSPAATTSAPNFSFYLFDDKTKCQLNGYVYACNVINDSLYSKLLGESKNGIIKATETQIENFSKVCIETILSDCFGQYENFSLFRISTSNLTKENMTIFSKSILRSLFSMTIIQISSDLKMSGGL